MRSRTVCLRCGRVLTLDRNGRLRAHFCPHRTVCQAGFCDQCQSEAEARSIGANVDNPSDADRE